MLFAVDIMVWHYAIRDVGAGLATVLGNLQVVVVPFLALALLGERDPAQHPGRAAAGAAAACCSSPGRWSTAPTARTRRAARCSASPPASRTPAYLLVQRQGSMDLRRPAGALFEMSLVAARRVAWRSGWRSAPTISHPAWPSAGWLITLALTSQVLGWLLITVSLPRLPAALTSIILTIQPIASVGLGAILLGQEPSALQLLGVTFILAGVLSVAVKKRRAPAATAG